MMTFHKAADYVRAHLGEADAAVVLGSGLGDYAENLTGGQCVAYADIPGFPAATAPGHAGKWHAGEISGRRVYLLQGRIHAYEAGSLSDVTMYVRMMRLLGVKNLILTNAAGCVNTDWQPGDLMLMTDFINYAGRNPLTGPNMDEFGPRFPDMSKAFDPALRELCRQKAQSLGLTLRQGVYMWFLGPCYETPAEIRMARILGADAVGMSTVPEVIVARHCGIRVLGLSCLTNMAAGILDQPLSHEEVTQTANRVKERFAALITAVLGGLTEVD